MSKKNDVFISYSSKEYDVAREVRRIMMSYGFKCWMAPESMPAGSNYAREIPGAIRGADAFVLLISKAAQDSKYVPNELDQAYNEGKPIFPMFIEDCKLNDEFNFTLRRIQMISGYDNLEESVEDLIVSVKQTIAPDEVEELKGRIRKKHNPKLQPIPNPAPPKPDQLKPDSPKQKSDSGKLKKIIIAACAVFAVAVGVVTTVMLTSQKDTMPSVVNMSSKDAKEALEEKGLSVVVKKEYTNDVEKGKVISQSPSEGEELENVETVKISVCAGKIVDVPDVVNRTEDAAEEAVENLGLIFTVSEKKYSTSFEKGCVISQSAKAGTSLNEGSELSVVVSKGEKMYTVPNVKGYSLSTAKSKLSNSKMSVTVKEEYNSSVSSGNVISQSVSAGKEVKKNTKITITVSKGAKPVATKVSTNPPTYTPTPKPTTPATSATVPLPKIG
ncbi:MAG: PASTA domain-containing protein [Ruminococcus sp.]|nr:PASTA domain-containing protein [Ruminococcus sp.]